MDLSTIDFPKVAQDFTNWTCLPEKKRTTESFRQGVLKPHAIPDLGTWNREILPVILSLKLLPNRADAYWASNSVALWAQTQRNVVAEGVIS